MAKHLLHHQRDKLLFCANYFWLFLNIKIFEKSNFGGKNVSVFSRSVTVFKHLHPNNKEIGEKICCGKMLPPYSDSTSTNNSIYSVE